MDKEILDTLRTILTDKAIIIELKELYNKLLNNEYSIDKFYTRDYLNETAYIILSNCHDAGTTFVLEMIKSIFVLITIEPDFVDGVQITKLHKEWFELRDCFKLKDWQSTLYSEYISYWSYFKKSSNNDFCKCFKLYGIRFTKNKWEKRLKKFNLTFEYGSYNNHLPIRPKIFNILVELFKKKLVKNPRLFLPLATYKISNSVVREDSDYFLITTTDIIKIDYICECIISNDERDKFLHNIIDKFTNYSKEDVNDLYDILYNKNKKYRSLLQRAKRMKRR